MDIWESFNSDIFLRRLEDTYTRAKHEIEDKYVAYLDSVEKEQKEIDDMFCTSVKDVGISVNAIVPTSDIIINQNEGELPDALYIGKLYNSGENEFFIGPAVLPFASSMSTGFLINSDNEEEITSLMQSLYLRLMICLPIRLCRFYFVDLHSYGQAQKFINRLSEKLKKNVVSEKRALDDLLSELESTIRSNNERLLEYPNLQEFNKSVAIDKRIPYHFVFFSHLHEGPDYTQVEHIVKLCSDKKATNGGIYFFYSVNPDIKTTYGVSYDNILNISTTLSKSGSKYLLNNSIFGQEFETDFCIDLDWKIPDNYVDIINIINERAKYSISFDTMLDEMISSGKIWLENSIKGVSIPIGVHGMNEIIYFALSEKTNDFFAMIAGRSGCGKTVLLHNIICNASLLYSPEELEFYLIDCTNGTSFKTYTNLPHARFVSITKQREYTDSALDYLKDEMNRRADLFKEAAVNEPIEKIETYRSVTGAVLPQIIVIIDELQVLLKGNDPLARKATGTLEKLIAEGRKYGIKIVLSTQSFRDLDLKTDNITLRIAFNLEERDSQNMLGSHAATKLTEKGEAILKNEKFNIKFQCAYIDDKKRQSYIEFCTERYSKFPGEKPSRFVFDGKLSGDIGNNKLWLKNIKSSSSN